MYLQSQTFLKCSQIVRLPVEGGEAVRGLQGSQRRGAAHGAQLARCRLQQHGQAEDVRGASHPHSLLPRPSLQIQKFVLIIFV